MKNNNKKDPPKNKKAITIKSLIFSVISLAIALAFPTVINHILQNSIIKTMLSFTVVFICAISCFEYFYHFICGKDFIGIKNLLPWNRKSRVIKDGFEKTEEIITEIEIKIKKESKNMEKIKEKVKDFWKYLKLHCGAFVLDAGIIVTILLAVLSNIESMGMKIMISGHNITPFISIILTGVLSFLKDGTLPIFKSNAKTELLKTECNSYNESIKAEKERLKSESIAKQEQDERIAKAKALIKQREEENSKAQKEASEKAEIEALAEQIEAERIAKANSVVDTTTNDSFPTI